MTPEVPEFIPPFPDRPTTRLALPELIRRFRGNMLGVWQAQHFARGFIATSILRRRLFICNNPETVRAAFVEQHAALERKSPQMRQALAPLLGDGLFVSDGPVWRQRRRAVAPVTHASRLAQLTPVMTEVAEEWRRTWAALPQPAGGAEVDALAEMAEMTAEIICRTLFGRTLGQAAARTVVRAFSAYQAKIGQTALGAMLGLPEWLPNLDRFRIGGEVRQIHAVLDRLVGAALAGGAESSLVRAMAEGGVTSRRALRNEAATLFMAGHETTANTLAWAWFLLSQAPWAAQRLAAEAQAALGGRAAGFADLDALPYARAVIEETLRLYPPVPLLAREAVAETEILGQPVPRGSLVLVVPWMLHRNPTLWDRPDHFRPERFLGPPPARYSYIPFSLGPRVCSGQQFGLAESVIGLASLAQHFHLALRPGAVVAPVCRLTLRPGEALPMRVLPRAAA